MYFFLFLFDVCENVLFQPFNFVELFLNQKPVVGLLDLLVHEKAPRLRVEAVVEEGRIVVELHGTDSEAQALHGVLEFFRLLFGLRDLTIDERPQFALFLLLALPFQVLEHGDLAILGTNLDGDSLDHGKDNSFLSEWEHFFALFLYDRLRRLLLLYLHFCFFFFLRLGIFFNFGVFNLLSLSFSLFQSFSFIFSGFRFSHLLLLFKFEILLHLVQSLLVILLEVGIFVIVFRTI